MRNSLPIHACSSLKLNPCANLVLVAPGHETLHVSNPDSRILALNDVLEYQTLQHRPADTVIPS